MGALFAPARKLGVCIWKECPYGGWVFEKKPICICVRVLYVMGWRP